jgi:23S rRNA (guanine745-N1)-methyltransferase
MPLAAVLEVLRCPVCRAGLVADRRTVRCASGHAFDVARQGYLNLLGRAAPRSADTAAMVAARERFLGRGLYEPIAEALAAIAGPAADDRVVVEVGAGTGYYLARLLRAHGGRGLAIDVSTAAVRRAAAAGDRIGAIVADAWQDLPLADATVEVLLSVFAPRNPGEFARLLRPGGRLLVVSPLPDHLVELRGPLRLLGIQEDKQDRIAATLAEDFSMGTSQELRYQVSLDRPAATDLVQMGPNAFHRDLAELAGRVDRLPGSSSVTVAVEVSAWRLRQK